MPRDENIQNKKLEKFDKYKLLKIELEQQWKVKIMVIALAVGAIANRLPGGLVQIPETISEVELQKTALLGTAQVSGVSTQIKLGRQKGKLGSRGLPILLL